MLAKYFDLDAAGTSIRTEIAAGLTTFVTMSYMVFVNPQILSAAGMAAAPCSWRPASPPPSGRW